VDLQLPGGQITAHGFFFGTQSRIEHAVIGGTGSYLGARGEFSFTSPSPGVLDMTLTPCRCRAGAHTDLGAGIASLRLSPLPEQEVATMLDALLGTVPNGHSRAELAARCGGVPLYAEEFAQLASQESDAAVPPTLAAVIGARLDTVGHEHRAVLQSAAVAGSPS
jgi:hypothetical protein